MLRVALNLTPHQAGSDCGIGRVVAAQWKYLPQYGIELTHDPTGAEVRVAHVHKPSFWNGVEVVHCHGMYFSDVSHTPYFSWHYQSNRYIIDSIRQSVTFTVPSAWVGMPFRRDMRLTPQVIPHGIDLEEWGADTNQGYILWNKNRGNADVCDPTPAWELARAGLPVSTTVAPAGREIIKNLQVLGTMPYEQMKDVIRHTDVYLATTLETFGIGTLEAMACGVPVLGYAWGGTADIVRHKVDGYLVREGDIAGLLAGYEYIQKRRAQMGQAATQRAAQFTWEKIIQQYASLYQSVADYQDRPTRNRTAVVITNYNYGRFVEGAIESCLAQTQVPDRIIVVDDGSQDNSREVLDKFGDGAERSSRISLVYQENSGVAAARNHGIELADDCELITCLDADDEIAPQFIETLSSALAQDRGLGIAYSGLLMMPEGQDSYPAAWPPEFSWEIQSNPTVPPANCVPSGCMYRRSMWERAGGYRQEYAPGEDAEFWTRGLSVGFGAKKVTAEPLFRYRLHGGSASRTKKYIAIDDRMPWMRDHGYPLGAPVSPTVRKMDIRAYLLPSVSVIVPVGPGHTGYIEQAVESVLGQTLRAWELIVVDDTGGELTPDQARALRVRYPFIQWIKTEGGQGAGMARNYGLEAAKGAYVCFLDADDALVPDSLATMLEIGQTQPCKYVYSDWTSLDSQGRLEAHKSPEYDQNSWEMLHPVTALIPRSQALEIMFDPSVPGWEDWDFFIKMAIHGYCGLRVPQSLLIYRTGAGYRRKTMKDNGSLTQDGLMTLEVLKQRYLPYYQGEKKMATCSTCGGGDAANEIIELKRRLGILPPAAQTDAAAQDANVRVRMEFTGVETGAVSFNVNGHIYRGSASPFHKYIDVPAEDVAGLEASGRWRSVVLTTPNTAAMMQADQNAAEVAARVKPKAPTAANMTEAELRAQIQANIMAVKAENAAREEAEAEEARQRILEEVQKIEKTQSREALETSRKAKARPAREEKAEEKADEHDGVV